MGGRGPNDKRVWCGQVQQIAEAEEALMTSCSDGVDERALVTPDDLSLGDGCRVWVCLYTHNLKTKA